MVVIGTYRTSEAASNKTLVTAIGRLTRESRFNRIELSGLGATEMAELVAASTDEQITDDQLALLSAGSGGSPLFLTELARILGRAGAIPTSSGGPQQITDAIQQMIERRSSGLSTESRSVLQTAALIGESFDLELLRR
ncbi:MAG: hypothetical protein O3B95_05115, partial [Chloroflexi bacterium]|nr:hypothetical protein [Chloroflexota bacterium]